MFIRDKVTGVDKTSIIPVPYTSVVLIGEFPIMKSPCDEDNAKAAPLVDSEDCTASHQFIKYRPVS
jgi:hypothetical protein